MARPRDFNKLDYLGCFALLCAIIRDAQYGVQFPKVEKKEMGWIGKGVRVKAEDYLFNDEYGLRNYLAKHGFNKLGFNIEGIREGARDDKLTIERRVEDVPDTEEY